MPYKIDIRQLRQAHAKEHNQSVQRNFGTPENIRKEDISFSVFDISGELRKFGYTCPPMYIDYPFFIVINGQEKQIHPGKNGIYETQVEKLPNGDEITFNVSQILLPVDVPFIFDYEIVKNKTV